MRAAIFTDNDFAKVNGVTTTLRAVLRHAPAGWSPRVYTASDTGTATDDYVALRSRGIGLPWYGQMRVYWPRVHALAGELARQRPDVIHITTPGPVGLAARWLAWRLGIPATGSYHTNLGDYVEVLSGSARLGDLLEQYMRWLYGSCRTVLVPSAATRDALITRGHRANRLRLWPRGVDVSAFAPVRRSPALRECWGVSDERPAIIYVGRLSREKGLGLLGPLTHELTARRVPHRLVVVGDGPMAHELKRTCPDAAFLGEVSHQDVATAMASADMFLFPSETDTFGNVVLEAQASGLPTLVTDAGGPQEHVSHGTTGFICRAGTVSEFAVRIESLVSRPARRAEMSEAARVHARGRDWPSSLAPLFAAWREAAASTAAPGTPPAIGQRHRSHDAIPASRPRIAALREWSRA